MRGNRFGHAFSLSLIAAASLARGQHGRPWHVVRSVGKFPILRYSCNFFGELKENCDLPFSKRDPHANRLACLPFGHPWEKWRHRNFHTYSAPPYWRQFNKPRLQLITNRSLKPMCTTESRDSPLYYRSKRTLTHWNGNINPPYIASRRLFEWAYVRKGKHSLIIPCSCFYNSVATCHHRFCDSQGSAVPT